MQMEIRLVVDSDDAKKIIRYAELLERVSENKLPGAKTVDIGINLLLDNEDMRTYREIFLEKSKSFTIFNCANHINAQDPEWIKNNPDHCYCRAKDSTYCYDCEVWEEIEGVKTSSL